jgi:hypothetical protein
MDIYKHPKFLAMMDEANYDEVVEKITYVSLEDLCGLTSRSIDPLLKYFRELSPINTNNGVVVSYDQTVKRYQLVKEYKKRGRLLDAYLLDPPGAADILMRYGLDSLKRYYQTRELLSHLFNELGLADLSSDYVFDTRRIYLALTSCILVVNPITHQVERSIPVAGVSMIIGHYKDNLYVMIEDSVFSVSLSLPTVLKIVFKDHYNARIYRNFFYSIEIEDKDAEQSRWVIKDLDSLSEDRTINVDFESNQTNGKYFNRNGVFYSILNPHVPLIDLTSQARYFGSITEDILLFRINDQLMTVNMLTGIKVVNKLHRDIQTYCHSRVSEIGKLYLLSHTGCFHLLVTLNSETLEIISETRLAFATGQLILVSVDSLTNEAIFIDYLSNWRLVFSSLSGLEISRITLDQPSYEHVEYLLV